MNMNKEQVQLAVQTGLELLGPESNVAVPAKLTDGVFFLKALLAGIAAGKIGLSTPPSGDGPTPPKPTRNQRRVANKKAAKKKVSKKKS